MQLSELAYRPIGQIQLRYLNLRRFVSPDNSPVHQEFGEPYMRLVYIVRGRAVFEADGAQFEAGDYSLVYIPRNTEYRSSWLPGSVRELAIMDIDLRDEQDCPIGFGEQAEVLFHDEHGLYAGYFGEIAHMDEDDAPYRWLERMAMALKLCCEIARQRVLQTEGPRSARIYTALAYLEHNYAQDTPVRELARMCALMLRAHIKPVEAFVEQAKAIIEKIAPTVYTTLITFLVSKKLLAAEEALKAAENNEEADTMPAEVVEGTTIEEQAEVAESDATEEQEAQETVQNTDE